MISEVGIGVVSCSCVEAPKERNRVAISEVISCPQGAKIFLRSLPSEERSYLPTRPADEGRGCLQNSHGWLHLERIGIHFQNKVKIYN